MEKLKINYRLGGKELLPLFLLFYVVMVPYFVVVIKMQQIALSHNTALLLAGVALILICIIGLVWLSYMFNGKFISGFVVDEVPVEFTPRSLSFFLKVSGGFILTVVTLIIYFPWYIKDLTSAFAGRVSANGHSCSFEGKGKKLFAIFWLSLIIPVVVFFVIFFRIIDPLSMNFVENWIYQLIFTMIIVPYIYLMYKWMVDFRYNLLHIVWDTEFVSSVKTIAIELFLVIITLGIYFPAAVVNLYRYFIPHTVAKNQDGAIQYRLNCELDTIKGFLLIWGQILLSVITAGIYAPWAMVKCTHFFLAGTWIEKQS